MNASATANPSGATFYSEIAKYRVKLFLRFAVNASAVGLVERVALFPLVGAVGRS